MSDTVGGAEPQYKPPPVPLRLTLRRRGLGLLMVALMAGFVTLSIAVYNKDFTRTVMVTIYTDHTGNELTATSDVKVRGVLVGSVRSVSSHGDGAAIRVALSPDKVAEIPDNVSAVILPKTLFGERYISLNLPTDAGPPIKGGDSINQDRSSSSIEIEQVLDDLLPVLQALRPAELSATLNAVATALNGRGKQLGTNIEQADSYLKELDPDVPQLISDVDALGKVALEYNGAAPDLLQTLTNLQTTSATLVQKQTQLSALLASGISTSASLDNLLADNGSRLIAVSAQTQAVASLLAEYSPEYQCLLDGMGGVLTPEFDSIFQGTMRITVLVTQNRGKYVPGDEPKNYTGAGPTCAGLPNATVPYPGTTFPDGVGGSSTTAGSASASSTAITQSEPVMQSEAITQSEDQAAIGSAAETEEVAALIAGSYGTAPDQVPSIATVLAAPLLRGTVVSATAGK